MTLYEQLGGQPTLKAILEDFYDRIFDDIMIGYLFQNQDKARLVDREVEWTGKLLGADISYRGRSMREVHRDHRILKGHFERRFRLLENTLADHNVPVEVQAVWLAHTRSLERAVLGAAAERSGCDTPTADDHGAHNA